MSTSEPMTTVATDSMTPDELLALGFSDLSQAPKTVEIPALPAEAPPKGTKGKKRKVVEGPSTMPAPTEEVRRAAQEIVNGPIEKPDEVQPAVMAAFVTHLLGGQPFRQSYEYFGGMVQLTLQTVDNILDDRISAAAMIHDPQLGDLSGLSPQALLGARIRFRNELALVFSVHRLAVSQEDRSPNWKAALAIKGATLAGVRESFLGGISPTVYSVLVDAHQQFRDTYTGLLGRAKDPSFWKAVSPG